MIDSKQKKCKGTGKAKGYGCGELSNTRTLGLCRKCYASWLTSTDEGKERIKRFAIKAKQGKQRERQRLTKKQKEDNKSIAQLIKEARAPFQWLIRARDLGKQCICCDKFLGFEIGSYDAGHFHKAETNTGLVFHPDNVHGQKVYCNQHLHGNESGYSVKIEKRIGTERLISLNSKMHELKGYKWDRCKLIELKKHYTSEAKAVKAGLKDINEVDYSPGIIN